jgi:hypothetical protein
VIDLVAPSFFMEFACSFRQMDFAKKKDGLVNLFLMIV